MLISFDIKNIARTIKNIARIDISSPLKGRRFRNTALNPKKDITPIPQATHPGTIIPRIIPAVATNPVLFENSFNLLTLKNIIPRRIPTRTLIETSV